ncbi:hypothetical protein [Streptomyces sp. NPDC016845]|uniref:hypothetical protein n=1 Tax=Streptomyces sp. NPDC016845 TaxID=3364972 RepID=UPI0037901BA8
MRTAAPPAVRRALAVAALTALPWTLAASTPAFADGVDVHADGSTVTAAADSCPYDGTAVLLASGQADAAQGRRTPLRAGTATWRNLGAGLYQVVIVCPDGTTQGPVPVTVPASRTTSPATSTNPSASPSATAPAPASPKPSASATPHPVGGVRGGLGGALKDPLPFRYAVGSALLVAAAAGGAWYLRHR